mmetsp:Transcript_36619/g.43762  ORF Transcript_36619/g.43762 Transcript_36619/m.43762 type:complete len:146 (-) Transcript_36619:169-606(-)
MTQHLAHQCNFKTPEKCTNSGSKAYTSTIMSNASVPILLETQFARQGHKTVVSTQPYGRSNMISEKRLQDGLCAMPTNSEIVSLSATCTNPHAPPSSTPSISRVTPSQLTKSPIQCRELEIITLQKQLDTLTKEKIALMSLRRMR